MRTKQVKHIKKLVSKHLGRTTKRVDRPPTQGMFSRIFFVTLADGREVVIQFRTERLDLDTFKVAKCAFSQVVPDAVALQDEELENIGVHSVTGKDAEGRITVNKSLGRVLSKGYLADNSASSLDEVTTYRPLLRGFLDRLNEISNLPFWVSHYDLNEVNILIDESCEVTGLIDWELSTPKPFAVGREFWIPEEFEVAERAPWNELFAGMAQKTHGMLEKNIDLVQDAVILGTLLDTFFWEDRQVGYGEISMKALPRFLTYRITPVRGDEPPYKE
ncbi:hypothetical protein C7999DRAFT_39934 [Corynascus novoguineensis]|uniref:Aminoglycoside phosphotransferase domain-containing protein n=1 Tax=Corynascus novoguineensis TaxID=1126955 RepID=A0AAN7CXX6_9PEZI|nr:hypothetical protein C7999DRAFT_39934 [Corynascus novoguineensis]